MRLSAAIEEVTQVDRALLLAEFGTTWPKIVSTRNAIAHNYEFVDATIITATAERNLPRLLEGIVRMRAAI